MATTTAEVTERFEYFFSSLYHRSSASSVVSFSWKIADR